MDINKKEAPIRIVRVYAHCGKCGERLGKPFELPQGVVANDEGEFVPMNNHLFLYKCPQCGEEVESDVEYPHIEYREA